LPHAHLAQGQAQQFVQQGRRNPKLASPNILRLYTLHVFRLPHCDTTSPNAGTARSHEFLVAKHEAPVH
jgi:hypothetical protein